MKEESLGLGSSIRARFFKGKRKVSPGVLKKIGKQLKANFLAKVPALASLIKAVKAKAGKAGYLRGLDGRHVPVRHAYAALNTLLQSAGAILCKKWMVLVDAELKRRGYRHGWDGDYAMVAWVHDELQIITRTKELADEIGEISAMCARATGEHFEFACQLDADYKIGPTWAETH